MTITLTGMGLQPSGGPITRRQGWETVLANDPRFGAAVNDYLASHPNATPEQKRQALEQFIDRHRAHTTPIVPGPLLPTPTVIPLPASASGVSGMGDNDDLQWARFLRDNPRFRAALEHWRDNNPDPNAGAARAAFQQFLASHPAFAARHPELTAFINGVAVTAGGMHGLGQATTTTVPATTNSFGTGFGLWFSSPTTAINSLAGAVSNLSQPISQGILAVPLLAAAAIYFYSRK